MPVAVAKFCSGSDTTSAAPQKAQRLWMKAHACPQSARLCVCECTTWIKRESVREQEGKMVSLAPMSVSAASVSVSVCVCVYVCECDRVWLGLL